MYSIEAPQPTITEPVTPMANESVAALATSGSPGR